MPRRTIALSRLAAPAQGKETTVIRFRSTLLALAIGASSLLPSAFAADVSDAARAVVAAEDRTEADRALDAGRKPAELLTFIGVKPGWVVADIAAGGGYTTELLQRAVGDAGLVYGQNSKMLLEKFLEKPWSARLARPVMQRVVRVDADFDDPIPSDALPLDAVTMVLFYHDTVWVEVDRAAMNRAIFSALKPGGVYVIVDHSAKPGDGDSVAGTFHRIDEELVKSEVQAAGFVLDGSADFLRNPADTRDWNDSPRAAGDRRGTSDRFVLRFRKP